MDFGNLFNSLWNMALLFIEIIGVVWNWLTSPIEVNIPFLSDIAVIGDWFNFTLQYSPMELLGDGILFLLLLWFVKNLIPLG